MAHNLSFLELSVFSYVLSFKHQSREDKIIIMISYTGKLRLGKVKQLAQSYRLVSSKPGLEIQVCMTPNSFLSLLYCVPV